MKRDLTPISEWLDALHQNHRGWFHTLLIGIVLAAFGLACVTKWIADLF